MAKNRKNRKVMAGAFAWDTAWKLAAIVVAVRRRDWKWAVPLLVTNSMGLLPMFYLWRKWQERSASGVANDGGAGSEGVVQPG